MAATAKVITIKGDPKKPESAEHIINFPGGCISVCRTSDNKYWAHIYMNQGQVLDEVPALAQKLKVLRARADYNHKPTESIDSIMDANHIAVLMG